MLPAHKYSHFSSTLVQLCPERTASCYSLPGQVDGAQPAQSGKLSELEELSSL